MQDELLFSGFGGQGVMFAGQLLAYAAMDEGLHVTWIPSYGPEMRGGTAHCFVIVSDQPIGSPIVRHPQVALVFNNPSFEKYEPLIAPGGLMVVNASMVAHTGKRDDITYVSVPASDIASELGNIRLTNVVLLGALVQMRSVVPLAAIRHALEDHMPSHRRAMLDQNYAALEKGAAFVTALAVEN